MLLLRYQRQRADEDGGGGHRLPSSHDMRRTKINDHDLKGDSRRAATRGTLVCIFVCGSLLLSLGLAVLFVGLLAPVPRKDPTPWLVVGPTCIVLGILVLLLSVEIILKLRRIAASDGEDPSSGSEARKGGNSRQSWAEDGPTAEEEQQLHVAKPQVVVHPATPLQPLDVASLPGNVVQR